MKTLSLRTAVKSGSLTLAIVLACSGSLFAQSNGFNAYKNGPADPAATPAPISYVSVQAAPAHHHFLDRENYILFAGVGAANAADFYVTHANLASGGVELNPVTRVFGRHPAGLAMNFSAQTAGVIGLSYLFHKTGHHKLERINALVNMSASGAAVSYDFAHR